VRSKKGISPLIATVLLIGFTIVLAALVMRWGTQLFEGTAETQECLSLARIDCTGLEFSLSATTWEGDGSDGEAAPNSPCINLTVRNNGAKAIDRFIFVGTDENGATTNYYKNSEKILFSVTDNTNPVGAFDSETFGFEFYNGTQINETVAIEAIPVITHTTGDGESCSIECTEKSGTYFDFDWVV